MERAQGAYSHRVALDGDEVGRLGMAFDAMAAAIATAFATQRRFVADASHELRTPLTALRGYSDVLWRLHAPTLIGERPTARVTRIHARIAV